MWQLTPMPDNAELAMLKAASSETLQITLGSIQVDVNLFVRLMPGRSMEIISPFERKAVQLADLSGIFQPQRCKPESWLR